LQFEQSHGQGKKRRKSEEEKSARREEETAVKSRTAELNV